METAVLAQKRRDEALVRANDRDQPAAGGDHSAHLSSSTASRSHATNVAKSARTTSDDAMTTYSAPSCNETSASAARMRRFARFRATAFPTLLPATTPTRGEPSCSRAPRMTVTAPMRRRDPVRKTCLNADLPLSDSYGRRLRGESTASLVATPLDEGATGLGVHAVAKAMTTLTTPHLWLICAFHIENPTRGENCCGRLRRHRRFCKGWTSERVQNPNLGTFRENLPPVAKS